MDWAGLNHPERLWWLCLLPLLYLLSLPPRPRRRVCTAHLLVWQRALAATGRRTVRFRLWRFLLLVLACIVGVLAATEPRVSGEAGARHLAVVLDDSPSMGSRDGDAWNAARRRLRSEFEELPENLPVTVVLPARGEVLRGRADRILERLPGRPAARIPGVSAGPEHLERLVASLEAPDTAVWTLTDGLGPTLAPGGPAGALTLVGQPGENVAITDCRVLDTWPLPDIELELELLAWGGGERTVRLAVSGTAAEGPAVAADAGGVEVPLTPGQARRLVLPLRRTAGGTLRVEIQTGGGDLATDDVVEVLVPQPPAPEVGVASPEDDGSPWLRAAADALAEECGGTVVLAAAGERVGLLLIEGGWLDAAPSRCITFGTGFGDPAGGVRSEPLLLDWDREDPRTRGLDFSGLQVDRALPPEALPPGKVLLSGEGGPLLVSAPGDGSEAGETLHAAFQLADSNLPLLAAFPQLLRRAYRAAYGERAEAVVRALENPLSPEEADLRRREPAPVERALPAFARPGASLSVPLLVLAVLLLALRVYT